MYMYRAKIIRSIFSRLKGKQSTPDDDSIYFNTCYTITVLARIIDRSIRTAHIYKTSARKP